MSKNTKNQLSGKLAEIVVVGMQEKKGNDIVRMDMRGVNATLSDYFVICHADSTIQVNAIAKSVEEEVYKAFGQEPWHKEGHGNGEWILLDFVDVVVHIFKTEKRSHYGIEDLWGDAQVQTYQSA
ncbi:ribosome-associated protein [Sphingobacterium allocomposti]|uniref:Ribosomal silencing factor RsfS n=1 Tax=Sphingobacterium allocomposti TaxID=415956 RepID=A0A5S5DFB6_9SPHI|nr:ribosome silencing factor [Sphingobacterium composti Yoo et al. 2007 non Ten et al. 2007]TYP94710.1 ribosome-associated protein [Sphingobacterium composti Yoo et al. 2007 non Ten et al. 2007]HLS94374.1 ribosome silencing factor [Sphingobacterium sp.]